MVWCDCQILTKSVWSPEMRPSWYQETDIPFDKMWVDDKYWFPLMLERKLFKARFLFEGHETILKHSLEVVDDLK